MFYNKIAPATAATSAESPTNPPGRALKKAAPVCDEALPLGIAVAGMGNAMVSVVVKKLSSSSEPEPDPLPELPELDPDEPEVEPED